MHCSFVCVRACVRVHVGPQEQPSIDHETDECVLCEAQHETEQREDNRKYNKI